MSEIAVRILVTGTVQGVGYRHATRAEARARGLRGWVRNLPDGAVEARVAGEERAVRGLIDWLWQGPPAASVDDVVVAPAAPPETDGFEIRR